MSWVGATTNILLIVTALTMTTESLTLTEEFEVLRDISMVYKSKSVSLVKEEDGFDDESLLLAIKSYINVVRVNFISLLFGY